MKSVTYTWFLTALVALLPVVVFLSVESVQRYRYSVMEAQVESLMSDIRAAVKLEIGQDGHFGLAQEVDRGRGTFEVRGLGRGGRTHEEQTWCLTYLFDRPTYPLAADAEVDYVFAVRLEQDRRILLLPPRVSVDYANAGDPLLVRKLETLVRARGLDVVVADRGF